MRRCNSPKMDDLGLVRTVFGSRLLLPCGRLLLTVPLLTINFLFFIFYFFSLNVFITRILYSSFLIINEVFTSYFFFFFLLSTH